MSHDAIYVAAPALANATLTHSVVATSMLLSRAACSLLTMQLMLKFTANMRYSY